MTAYTLPFLTKSNYPGLTTVLLLLVFAAIGFVAWQLWRHHREHRRARKLGINRKHDGRHGNH